MLLAVLGGAALLALARPWRTGVAGTTLWELASTPVHCWLLIGFAVLSAVACLHRRSALAVAAFGVIGFLLLFAIGTASLGRDGSSQATLGPWSFAVGDSVLCAVLAAYNFALIL